MRASVLMLHGAGGGAWEWTIWQRVFVAAGHTVSCPELQPSQRGLAQTRWEDYLAQSRDAARACGARPVLIGASLGGLLALATAVDIECAALILINPLPPWPEAARLPPQADRPEIVPWARDASLAGTRAALPDADAAACLYAFRRWRDESGAVLNQARRGIAIADPSCPVLVIASSDDEDVPFSLSASYAARLSASLLTAPGGHVGPLLGRAAAGLAEGAKQWLNGLAGFRTD